MDIKTYSQWHNEEFVNDLNSKVKSICITHGLSEQEVKDKPISELSSLYLEGLEMLNAKANPFFAVKYKGEELYFSMPTEGTIGEVADVESKMGSDKPWKVLSVFFRPVESDVSMKPWVESAGLEVKEISSFMTEYKKYKVKRYDTDDESLKKYQEDDYWDDFPAALYNSILDFTVGIGTNYSLAAQTYSEKNQLLDRENLSQLVGNLAILGDGIRSYSTWQKVTFSTSTETAA